jgi:predicted SprT family Zn-dependent metalloprotease
MKETVEKLAKAHISRHIPGWTFVWSDAVGYIGQCRYKAKQIALSEKYLHAGLDSIEQTILHEIAHALTPGEKHGPKWKAKALELGVKEPRASSKSITKVEGKWVMACRPCKRSYPRTYHIRHSVIKRRICHVCKGDLYWKSV